MKMLFSVFRILVTIECVQNNISMSDLDKLKFNN